jgi:uncharacterized protein (TIGR02421 family)
MGTLAHKDLIILDNDLSELVTGINILDVVSPVNFKMEKELFFKNKCAVDPNFSYRDVGIDAFALKRALFNLPIERIADEDLRGLYLDVVDSYVDKIDQCSSIGTPDFLYDSLRYYGEPTDKDIRNASFLLHLPQQAPAQKENHLDASGLQDLLFNFATQHQYEHELVIDDSMIANALVSGIKVKINSNVSMCEKEAWALAHHELGVHLVTTLNARAQPLKIMSIGCPSNTKTQEGLAILAEVLSGHVTIGRLQVLALRVLAAESMIKEKSFKQTYAFLVEQHQVASDLAFTITARVYRGGGFTKDYLYLQGLHEILNAYENEPNFNQLLVGKTTLEYLPKITRLIEKGLLIEPKYITPAFVNPVSKSDVEHLIIRAIQ